MRVVVSGGTGLIGRALSSALIQRGDGVTVLTRRPDAVRGLAREVRLVGWDPLVSAPPSDVFTGVDAVVHLAGEPVADRAWTPAQKARIHESRIGGTRNLVEGLRALNRRPPTFIGGSAVGYYGDRGDELLDERSASGGDFLAALCNAWEDEARTAERLGMRVVLIRTGIVLSADGGALPRLALPFRYFVGGPLGNGRQWMPWIHIHDHVRLLLHCLDRAGITGPVNSASPGVVRNREFARALGRALGRPAIAPMPRFLLRIVLGERVDVLLASQRARPMAAEASGFEFAFPGLESALVGLTGS
jgi:uncharacterized protein (TIGR01777 family)